MMGAKIVQLGSDETSELEPVLAAYGFSIKDCAVYRLYQGHLHRTLIIDIEKKISKRKFILQEINQVAFPETEKMLNNVSIVVEYIKNNSNNKFPNKLELIKTIEDRPFYYSNNQYWRCYPFIENSTSFDICPSAEHARALGRASGDFIGLLAELSVDKIHQHIEGFQDTEKKIYDLKSAYSVSLKSDILAKELYQRIIQQENIAATISREYKAGNIKARLIHYDTKVNNFLFDINKAEVLCLIDLDLCMLGTCLYDYGDLVRSAASIGREDEPNTAKVDVNQDLIKAVTEGFIMAENLALSVRELELMPLAPYTISLNLAARFLTDYLLGDKYFPISRPKHNLDRAAAQLRISEKLLENKHIIENCLKNCP